MANMGFAEILDRSFDILRKYIKTIVIYTIAYGMLALIGLVILVILGVIIGLIIYFSGAGNLFNGSTDNFTWGLIIFIGFLYSFIIASYSSGYQVGIIKITSQEFFQTRFYADQVIKDTLKSIFKVIGIVITAFFLFLPVIIIFGAIFYFMFPVIDDIFTMNVYGIDEVVVIILMIILVLLAFLMILVFATMLIFSIPAAVIEGKSAFNSIKRSYELVKNKFWRIFASVILIGLIIYAINISLQSFLGLITGIVFLIMRILSMEIDYFSFMTTIYQYSNWPLALINLLIITPIASIMVTLLYFNRRCEREGYDILLKIEQLKENNERKQSIDSPTT